MRGNFNLQIDYNTHVYIMQDIFSFFTVILFVD